jgi:hypothetical protein
MIADVPIEYHQVSLNITKELKFIDNIALTNTSLGTLPITLESLILVRCPNITDFGIASLHFLPKLKNLYIENCIGISGATFDSLPKSLRSLHVVHCPNFGDFGIKAIGLLSIKQLEISHCPITGATFSYLPSSLKYLKIHRCPEVKEQFLFDLYLLENLKKVDFSSNHQKLSPFFTLASFQQDYQKAFSFYLTQKSVLNLDFL